MNHIGRCNTALVLALIAGWSGTPFTTRGQAVLSLGGVDEGAVIVLPQADATTNLDVTATLANHAGSPNVVFWLEWQGALLGSQTSAPPYSASFTNLPRGKYFLGAFVQTETNVQADASFDIALAASGPVNDHWSNAVFIPSGNAVVAATNDLATREAGEPLHTPNGGGQSLWWRWQAVSNATVTVTTWGSDFDTAMAVYTGTNLSSLALIGANDDAGFGTNLHSQVSFPAMAGKEYFIAVDAVTSANGANQTGTVQLQLQAMGPPVVTITSPPDGLQLVVSSPTIRTNVSATIEFSGVTGNVDVRYWFDGAGISQTGTLSSPYELSLTNLSVGDYWLMTEVVNENHLSSTRQVGWSVVPDATEVLLVDTPALYTNGFRFAVRGRKGPNYALLASTNLEVWCSVTSWTNFAGVVKVTDTNAALFGQRFYRTVAQ